MRSSSGGYGFFALGGLWLTALSAIGCSGSSASFLFDAGGGADASGGGGGSGSGSSGVVVIGSGGDSGSLVGSSGSGSGGGGTTTSTACPAGTTCNVSCATGKTTTLSGKVYDPAAKNPLYGVEVYVPATPLVPLPKGVPTGADACSCGALYPSGAVTNASTAVDGSFTLSNVPVGASVPLVLQIGKWRRSLKVNVTECQDNPQPALSLTLPGTIAAGDTDDNMPDIAVSTGGADTLECLLVRVGVSAAEYVPGAATNGHVHVFSGGEATTGGGGGGGGGFGGGGIVGKTEQTPMAGAPASSTSLWSSAAQLMPYDVVLLSCEGGETYKANPPALESYLNGGGRAFASHYHYAWFSGPLDSSAEQTYTAPADWGSHLATWSADDGFGGGGQTNGDIGGAIDQTLNGSSMPFPKGATLSTWLDENGALGGDGVSKPTDLPIYSPRYNATVSAANTASQPWITADTTGTTKGATMYFSFDTPVDAPIADGGTTPAYCGRAVFSDLHVAGNPVTTDNANEPPPTSCYTGDLSPQEKALEFMLFDLSSCVIPDTVTVSNDAGLPPPPSK